VQGFVDTKIFLRYLLNDIPDQADAVEQILREVAKMLSEAFQYQSQAVLTSRKWQELPDVHIN